MAQTQVAVAAPAFPPGPTPELGAHGDCAAMRLLRTDAAARAWLLPPRGAAGGAGLTLSAASLRAAVAVDKRIQVAGSASRHIQLQFLFCPISFSNGRTLGVLECRSSSQVAPIPGTSRTLLPPRRCRFLMDETTREVVAVGWADTRMAATFAGWRAGAGGGGGEWAPTRGSCRPSRASLPCPSRPTRRARGGGG